MIWRDCEHYLESIDSRFGPEPEPVNIDAIAEPIHFLQHDGLKIRRNSSETQGNTDLLLPR